MVEGTKMASVSELAVASACVGAELLRLARASGSRRALGKVSGIPSDVIADIEDASVLPSEQQLLALQRSLPGVRSDLFKQCRPWGEIPWTEALTEILLRQPGLSMDGLARAVSVAMNDCEPGFVKWRLSRQLARLEGTGQFSKRPNGTWTVAPEDFVGVRQPPRGRWNQPALTFCDAPEQDALFHLESTPGQRSIVLNRAHPHYGALHRLLSNDGFEELGRDALRNGLVDASKLVRDLIVAWAEYEDAEKVGERQDRVGESRKAWGRHARRLATASGDDCVNLSL
jgi:hypothetical protein